MALIIPAHEILRHSSREDLWMVIDEVVWDMTEFAPEHPGGIDVLERYAGRDASQAYASVHAPSLVRSTLGEAKRIGVLDASSVDEEWTRRSAAHQQPPAGEKPPLERLINTHDFVSVARRTLTPKTWAFYSSGATDLHTMHRNASAYADIGLRPAILTNVKQVDTSTRMLGQDISVPIFCSPAAMAKMVHPEGEKAIARGCRAQGVPQCISTNASFPIAEIVASINTPGRYGGPQEAATIPLFFQLYVDKQRAKSEALLRHVEALGIKAIFVTVDAPVAGKREADERLMADETLSTPMSGARAKNDARGGALGRIMGAYIDATLSWDDLAWVRSCTTLPLVLKGVQTASDAVRALTHAHLIDGLLVSNHGGRSLDTSPPAILVLLELQRCCPAVFDRFEVFVDGGIMRGTDIFKALCLGARSVGVGRGFLYALNYGAEGVEKYIEILKDELETTMRMMGVTDLTQLHPGLLNTRAVDHLIPENLADEHPYAKWQRRPLKARI